MEPRHFQAAQGLPNMTRVTFGISARYSFNAFFLRVVCDGTVKVAPGLYSYSITGAKILCPWTPQCGPGIEVDVRQGRKCAHSCSVHRNLGLAQVAGEPSDARGAGPHEAGLIRPLPCSLR